MLLPHTLIFASDATMAAIAGGASLAVAGLAMVAERRRIRRRQIDSVGWVPWTTLFLIAAFVGVTLMGLAIKGWMAG